MKEVERVQGLKSVKPGRHVYYRNDGRGGFDYYVPAIISVTRENLVRKAVDQGLIEDLDSPLHVHLTVFGPLSVYHEQNVPFDSTGKTLRSWRFQNVQG